jgi:hypothetical protein
LILWPDKSAWKLRIHQAMTDVAESDIIAALGGVETIEAKGT